MSIVYFVSSERGVGVVATAGRFLTVANVLAVYVCDIREIVTAGVSSRPHTFGRIVSFVVYEC